MSSESQLLTSRPNNFYYMQPDLTIENSGYTLLEISGIRNILLSSNGTDCLRLDSASSS